MATNEVFVEPQGEREERPPAFPGMSALKMFVGGEFAVEAKGRWGEAEEVLVGFTLAKALMEGQATLA